LRRSFRRFGASAVTAWFAPCARLVGDPEELRVAGQYGLRSVRGVLRTFDANDEKNSKLAIAADLSSAKSVNELLDQIPLRTTLERSHSFGAYRGHSISVPGVGHLDYVVTDKLAIIGVGEGVLDKMNSDAPHTPLFALDVNPAAMSHASWQGLWTQVFGQTKGAAVAAAIDTWKDAHLAIAVDGDALVVEASGNRR